jgi:hypothetical protein
MAIVPQRRAMGFGAPPTAAELDAGERRGQPVPERRLRLGARVAATLTSEPFSRVLARVLFRR